MFPHGITFYLAGGILIGLALSLAYLFTGVFVGVSSSLSSFWSYISKHAFFQKKTVRGQRSWRMVFAVSIALGGFLYVLVNNVFFITAIPWWQLLLGGILVGYGVRMASGCTFGHGVNGVASFNLASVVAVIVFISVAIATAHVARFFGVLA